MAMSLQLEDGDAVQIVQEARAKLDAADGEMVLDLSSVRRIDAVAVGALEELAEAARQKPVTIALQGVSVELYKVLKLTKLASRFSFRV